MVSGAVKLPNGLLPMRNANLEISNSLRSKQTNFRKLCAIVVRHIALTEDITKFELIFERYEENHRLLRCTVVHLLVSFKLFPTLSKRKKKFMNAEVHPLLSILQDGEK